MEIKRMGDQAPRPTVFVLLPLLLAVVVLAGCAQRAAGPGVTSPATMQSEAVSNDAAGAPGTAETEPVEKPASEPMAEAGAAETDAALDPDAATDDDTEMAEEVEPSPLDELPTTAPELTPAEIAKDEKLVQEVLPTFDIPMVLNSQVLAYVDYFKSRHKDFFAASLKRSGRYVDTFQEVFEQAGIPKDLVYMAHVESAFKTNAYSRAKAKGIYQFISATGKRYGLRIDSWVDERSDPDKSARAAAAYLKDLYGMFGDWYLALAAYNAGEGKIQRSLAKTKKDDFWQLASTRALRAETRNYVPAILAATMIAKQPEKFGFDVEFDEPIASDIVRIDGQTDLRILARLAEVDVDTMRQLNPQLRRGMTPPGTTTDVRVPAGRGETTALAYANLPAAERLVIARHQVAKGESLAFVARHYGVTATAIAHANHLGKNSTLKQGQELIIPATAPAVRDGDVSRTSAVTYRVRKGDTLSRIAKNYRTTASAIASASRIGLHSQLRVGQRLVIPAKRQAARAPTATAKANPAPPASAVVHTVRRGETLYRIADRYQVTVDQICTLNRINPDGVIYPGTRLKIRVN